MECISKTKINKIKHLVNSKLTYGKYVTKIICSFETDAFLLFVLFFSVKVLQTERDFFF